MVKGHAAHVELRVERVCNLIASGALPGDVKRFCIESWDVKPRQADRYIAFAREKLRQDIGGLDRPDYLAQHIATLHTILKQSIKDRNWSCALGATAQLSRVTGLEKGL